MLTGALLFIRELVHSRSLDVGLLDETLNGAELLERGEPGGCRAGFGDSFDRYIQWSVLC